MKKMMLPGRPALGVFILFCIVGIGAQPRTQSPAVELPVAVNISHSSSNSDTPLIGVDRDGTAYVAWFEQLWPRQFYFATNKSGSWSAPLWLDKLYYDVEEAGWPEFAVSASGAAHLTYQDGKDPSLSYEIMGKSLSGGTWGPTVFVSNNAFASAYSGCAVNPVDETLFVVWQDNNGNTGVGEWNLLLRYRTAAGVWSENQTLPVGWGYMPKIAIDGTGTAHMVWGNSHGRTLYYSRNRTPQIASGWTSPVQIKRDCGLEWSNPQIACDLAGNVAFVWMDGANGYEQISCLRVNRNGSFYSEINVSQSAVPATDGAVALNPLNGDVLTVWAQGGNIYADACLGGMWTGPYNVTRGSGTAGMPRVAVDALGRAHLVYAQMVSGGTSDIMYMSFAGAIQVAAPNGGEVWTGGSSQTIRWTAPSSLATIKIELSTDNGASFQVVSPAAPNTGSYAWTVPNASSSQCLIKVSEALIGTPADKSDAPFSIVPSSVSIAISGIASAGGTALPDVIMYGLPGNPTSNASGHYTATVNYGWTGTAAPYKAGYVFSPPSRSYSSITANQSGQDYAALVALPTIKNDFNADGIQDILWRNDGTGQNAVWFMNGITPTGYSDLPAVADLNWKIVGTGDFNGDGKIDILWRNSSIGQNVVWFMNGITPLGSSSLQAVTDSNWKIVGTGDFDGDGKIDILWRNDATGQNAVWFMNGILPLGFSPIQAVTDSNWKIVGTGDFDGDGKMDILWRNDATGQNAAWLMNGTVNTGFSNLQSVTDLNWKIVGTGDFNADGKPDIIWRNDATGRNAVWYMNGTANLSYDYLPTVTDLFWKIVNR